MLKKNSPILITGGSGFIGTNLIELLIKDGYTNFVNLDSSPPLNQEHNKFWNECSLLDFNKVNNLFLTFKPEICIHMAAETDMKQEKDINIAYPVNTNASKNLLTLIKKHNVTRSIIVSTQYVCGPSKQLPQKNDDYWPHTLYGESKVSLEKNTRKILNPGTFIIVRPTYVWGPWHFKNFNQLINSIKSGFYIHPSGDSIIRSYGYVKNVCFQLVKLIDIDISTKDWYYVGDKPVDSYKFVNSLSLSLISKSIIKCPRLILYSLGKIGDMIKKIPINSFRYKNMTTSYPTPMDETFMALGEPPYSFDESIRDFTKWYKLHNGKA